MSKHAKTLPGEVRYVGGGLTIRRDIPLKKKQRFEATAETPLGVETVEVVRVGRFYFLDFDEKKNAFVPTRRRLGDFVIYLSPEGQDQISFLPQLDEEARSKAEKHLKGWAERYTTVELDAPIR